ncbi:hypothetical protein L210DRAFT_3569544 [Boletus edulis BED1]|uniref:Uncharacterized protein n=1 Tax=Boletus edulis BED1 TaxID=1328754 RepID=A0AAD4BE20_BOLED|nr:hypothetical protein L210DRAFT_3569544 [Boletus edulis BED1]
MPTRQTLPGLQISYSSFSLPRLPTLRTTCKRCPVDGGPLLRSLDESLSRTYSWVYPVCSREGGSKH